MNPRVHQLLTVFDEGDAQGVMALRIRRALQAAGCESEIFAGQVRSAPGNEAAALPPAGPKDVLILHYSIGSPATRIFLGWGGRRVLVYHNITPGRFFRGYDDLAMLECFRGRRELGRLGSEVDLALAVSEFNAAELGERGFAQVGILPFPLDEEILGGEVDLRLAGRLAGKGTRILFVGRLAPNKRQDLVIRSFQAYRDLFAPEAHLDLVGAAPIPAYAAELRRTAAGGGGRGITLTGQVSWPALRAYYRAANVFVCLSEHEGFCVPLIESLRGGIPILARAAGAIPETLGGAGVLVEQAEPRKLAVLLNLLAEPGELRRRVLAAQDRRLAELRAYPFDRRLREFLNL